MVLIGPLSGCEARLERARGHLANLDRRIREFIETKPYSIESAFSPDHTEYSVRLIMREQPPLDISVMIGELLYNMRSALDHLIFRLYGHLGITMPKRPEFPIYDKRDDFERNGKNFIKGLPDEVITIIEVVQPFHGWKNADGEFHTLWLLHKLGNIDKHRLLHLTQFVHLGPMR